MLTGLNSNTSASNLVVEKSSYCFNTMSRIETMKKAVLQTENLVNKTKESVELELNKMLKNSNVAVDLQKLKIRIRMLREQLNRERMDLEMLRRKKSFSLELDDKVTNNNNNNDSDQMLSNSLNHNLDHHNLSSNLGKNLNHNLELNNLSNSLPNHLLPNNSSAKNFLHCNLSSGNLSGGNYQSANGNFPNYALSSFNLPNSASVKNISSINSPSSVNFSSIFKDEDIKLVLFDQENFERDKNLLIKLENEILTKSSLLEKINESLLYIERRLITELYQIFTINESQDGKHTILGLNVPDLNNPLDENDAQIRISLGYCCQLLITISKVFDISLKHAILFSGSQSWIMSEAENPRLKDEKYPLFLYRDKSKFSVAIHLLNENIAQIRHHFNFQTSDHKKLSNNLFTLFQDKLLLKQESVIDGESNGIV